MMNVTSLRVAAIDLGTNSTRLRLTGVVRGLAITRLGEGVDVNHELLPAPIARVHAVLDGYAREVMARYDLAEIEASERDILHGGCARCGTTVTPRGEVTSFSRSPEFLPR